MNFRTNQRIPESTIYIIVWLVIFIIPVLVTTSNTGEFQKTIFLGWLRMVPFILIFIINTVWLLPELLFKGKTATYLLSVVITSFLLVFAWEYIFPFIRELISGNQGVPINEPQFIPDGQKLPRLPRQQLLRPRQRVIPIVEQERPPRGHMLSIFNQMIIAWLVVGFNTAIKITNKWFNDEQKKRELEKEHLRSELAFLQNQISPHFFMNTLNNIHALIDIDTKQAQSSVVTLSKMMRYLLYESSRGETNIQKEIEFLKSYVDLMRLRLDEQIDVDLEISEMNKEIKLPPLLFISFVENAFKHGVSYNEKSFIHIKLEQDDKNLIFTCHNSVSIQNKITNPYSGVGLENVKKRLELLFADNYDLDIIDKETEFIILLKIPLYEN